MNLKDQVNSNNRLRQTFLKEYLTPNQIDIYRDFCDEYRYLTPNQIDIYGDFCDELRWRQEDDYDENLHLVIFWGLMNREIETYVNNHEDYIWKLEHDDPEHKFDTKSYTYYLKQEFGSEYPLEV